MQLERMEENRIHFFGSENSVEKRYVFNKEEALEKTLFYFWHLRSVRPAFLLIPQSLRTYSKTLVLRYEKIHAEPLGAYLRKANLHADYRKNLESLIQKLHTMQKHWKHIGFSHGDLHLNNILFDGKTIAVIDPEISAHQFRFHPRYSHPLNRLSFFRWFLAKRVSKALNDSYGFRRIRKDLVFLAQ